jgi:hypothetical protein
MHMKQFIIWSIVIGALFSTHQLVQAQENVDTDHKFRLEVEPYSFLARGVSGSLLYAFDKESKFSAGLYAASMDIPKWSYRGVFQNVNPDIADVRLGFQLSASFRYKLNVFKSWESNPYVGLMLGWQYFDVSQDPYTDAVRLSTLLVTPNLGYEFYFFKKRIYINPQVRAVFYAGQDSNDNSRPEVINSFFILPQIAGGIRF